MRETIKRLLKEEFFPTINDEKLPSLVGKIHKLIDQNFIWYVPKYFRQKSNRAWALKKVVNGAETSVHENRIMEFIDAMGFDIEESNYIYEQWILEKKKEYVRKKGLTEDLEYYGVGDATKDKTVMGLKEDIPIYKEANPHKKVFTNLKNAFPNTPDYVLQDFFRAQFIKSPKNLSMVIDQYEGDPIPAMGSYWHVFLNGPWKLELLNVNPEDFSDNTVNAFLERDFGNEDAFLVPDDKERTEIQKQIAKGKGMNEPVIIVRDKSGKYELIEGWHRTMSALLLGDNGEDLKNWDKIKLRAWITDAK